MKMICQVRVPDYTKLETIQRYDIDIELGALVEVHFERKKEIDKSNLQGKRFRHLTMAVVDNHLFSLVTNVNSH